MFSSGEEDPNEPSKWTYSAQALDQVWPEVQACGASAEPTSPLSALRSRQNQPKVLGESRNKRRNFFYIFASFILSLFEAIGRIQRAKNILCGLLCMLTLAAMSSYRFWIYFPVFCKLSIRAFPVNVIFSFISEFYMTNKL
jgi:hypothetical protein